MDDPAYSGANTQQEAGESLQHESGGVENHQKNQSQDVSSATPKPIGMAGALGIVIVVLTLVYLWGTGLTQEGVPEVPERYPPTLPADDSLPEAGMPVKETDTIEAIEEDLANTEIETIDSELEIIESELDALLVE